MHPFSIALFIVRVAGLAVISAKKLSVPWTVGQSLIGHIQTNSSSHSLTLQQKGGQMASNELFASTLTQSKNSANVTERKGCIAPQRYLFSL